MHGLLLTGSGSGADLVSNVTDFVSSSTAWISSFANAVTSNEFLTLAVITVPLAGFGIGAIKRLIRFRA